MKRRNNIPHKRYCKVCKNFDCSDYDEGRCSKGWDITNGKYCELEDFIPSVVSTFFNFIFSINYPGILLPLKITDELEKLEKLEEGGAQ